KAGQVRYRFDKSGIIHTNIGKVKFTIDELKQNLEKLLTDLKKAKPAVSKCIYLKKVSVSSTMVPGINFYFSDLNI
ncbi:50S ribosomal protein L1, partial [Francisella tularensis subsp. holarctica]|nr:50S ribosomal protein L1 [Francisella tularensis subsp. holarctica]